MPDLKTAPWENDMIRWRRALHQIPEIGNDLPQTSAYVQSVLRELGLNYETYLGGMGLRVTIEGQSPGAHVFLRADMDALQIPEDSGLPFASTNGCMHACGHDGHTAMALGAAAYLAQNRQFPGRVSILFQPGEEYPGGALPMIEEGALEGCDAIFALHEGWLSREVPTGQIGFKAGPMMAAMDRFQITVHGKGGHGAAPENCNDPIVTAAEIILALQRLSSREVPATEPVIVSVCRVSGGYNQNILPSDVELEGTVRSLNEETRHFLASRIEEIARGIAGAHRATITFDYNFKYPPLHNDPALCARSLELARQVLGPERIYAMQNPVMGGEDMAYYLQKVPGVFFFMANPRAVQGHCYPHHHARFDVDEAYFKIGSSLLLELALDFLHCANRANQEP